MKSLQWLLLDDGDRAALEPFLEMMDAAREGRAPSTAAVAAIAAASEQLFGAGKTASKLTAFGKAMGLFGQQGRGRKKGETAGEWAKCAGIVGFMIQRERSALIRGLAPKKASAEAVALAAKKFHMGERNLQALRTRNRERVEIALNEALQEHEALAKRYAKQIASIQKAAEEAIALQQLLAAKPTISRKRKMP